MLPRRLSWLRFSCMLSNAAATRIAISLPFTLHSLWRPLHRMPSFRPRSGAEQRQQKEPQDLLSYAHHHFSPNSSLKLNPAISNCTPRMRISTRHAPHCSKELYSLYASAMSSASPLVNIHRYVALRPLVSLFGRLVAWGCRIVVTDRQTEHKHTDQVQ